MLRPFADPRPPLRGHDEILKFSGCPDCRGRGVWLIKPFAMGGGDGSGGIGNKTQCPTCADAYRHFEKHGRIPDDIAQAAGVDAATLEPTAPHQTGEGE